MFNYILHKQKQRIKKIRCHIISNTLYVKKDNYSISFESKNNVIIRIENKYYKTRVIVKVDKRIAIEYTNLPMSYSYMIFPLIVTDISKYKINK